MVEHAKYELDLLLDTCKDSDSYNMQKSINDSILDVVKTFAEYHHSGMTADYSISIINKLLNQSFITPLTGDDNEWIDVGDGLLQNKRESTIFKNTKGPDTRPYYINGRMFSDDHGKTWYTNHASSVPVSFPLDRLPETEYIEIEESD